jgi:hypothetical protein
VKSAGVIIASLALAAITASSCRENPVEQYGKGLTDAVKESRDVSMEASLGSARKSIAAFRATEGRNPESLDELAAYMGAALAPEDYAYDPATGEIRAR